MMERRTKQAETSQQTHILTSACVCVHRRFTDYPIKNYQTKPFVKILNTLSLSNLRKQMPTPGVKPTQNEPIFRSCFPPPSSHLARALRERKSSFRCFSNHFQPFRGGHPPPSRNLAREDLDLGPWAFDYLPHCHVVQ